MPVLPIVACRLSGVRSAASLIALAATAFGAPLALTSSELAAQSGTRLMAQASEIRPLESVVATVNGEQILFADVVQVFSNLGPQFQQLGLTTVYEQVVERLVEQRLMVQQAQAEGLDQTAEHRAEVKFLVNSVLEQSFLDQAFTDRINDASIQAAYEAFEAPAETKASHILVESEEEAKAIIARLDAGEDFAELAKSESTGPSGPNGGDLGYFLAEQMVQPFSVAAFELEPGSYTNAPVQTQFGWHIIQVMDRRVADKPSLGEMREGLTLQLQEQVLNEVLSELRGSAEIETQPLKQ